ncbi:MAG: tetratricopeptide repeat protein [Acidobacteriota bacterium]
MAWTEKSLFASLRLGVSLPLFLLAAASCSPAQPEIPAIDLSSMEPQVASKIRQAGQQVRRNTTSAADWGRLGMVLQAHTLFGPAAGCYRIASDLDPSDYRWPYLAAHSLRRTDLQAALDQFERSARLKPDNAAFHVSYGNALLEAGDVGQAEAQYRQALETNPQSSHALYGLALASLAGGHPEQALAHLERAVSLAPRHGELYTLLGQVLRRLGRDDQARQAVRAAQAYPDPTALPDPVLSQVRSEAVSSVALTRHGLALAANLQYPQAEKVFRQVLGIRPGNARDHVNLGASLAGQGRLEEAVVQYRKALRIQPDEAFAHHNLSLALSRQGKKEEALKHVGEAIRISPPYAEAHNQLGLLQAAEGQMQAALQSYRQALRLNPGLGAARSNLGKALASQGDFEGAVEQWAQAVSIDAANLEALHNLGIALALQGKHGQAIQRFEEGLEQAPNSSLFIRALAWELSTAPRSRWRDGARAVQLSHRVYQTYPDQPQAADLWAAALAESGRFDEAAQVAGQAVQIALSQNQPALARQIQQRLRLYQQGRPFHQSR